MKTLAHEFILPAAVAVFSAYIGVKVTLSTMEVDLNYLKRDVDTLRLIMEQVRENQSELKARGVWIKNKDQKDLQQDADIRSLWLRVNKLDAEIHDEGD